MQITPNTQTVGNLFFNTNEQFFIPPYQRRYAWGIKQLDALFNDINNLSENERHLLGMIIFLTEAHTAGVNKLELVDGQQRLTSLCLLLKVIQTELKNGEINESNEIENFLYCQTNNGKRIHKVELGDLDNSDFEKLMYGVGMEDVQNEKLVQAIDYFRDKVHELGDELLGFYNKLKNRVMMIRLDISEAKDAFKLFESINNRGLKLTVTDIIKNFILGHAALIGDDTLSFVKRNWTDLIINLDGIESDKYFRHFMMGKLKAKIPNSKLADQFKHYYYINVKEACKLSDYKTHLNLIERVDINANKTELDDDDVLMDDNRLEKYIDVKVDIKNFSKSLKNLSGTYSQIMNRRFENREINQLLFDLERIESTPALTFLLNLFQRNISDTEKTKLLKIIQVFILRRHICAERTSVLDDIFSKLVVVDDENIVETVKARLENDLPSDEDFKDKFAKYNFKGLENRAKYILEQLEYYLISNKNEYVLQTGNDVHLEHVIPQTIDTKKSVKDFGNWVDYLGANALEKHKDFVWMIGNLTILAQELNIKASNNPFKSKVKEYKKSNLKLNEILVKDYNNFKFKEVKMRSAELAEIAIRIWKF